MTLLLALAFVVQDGWWNADWDHRRALVVRNRLKTALVAGQPVAVRFNPAFLGMGRTAKADLGDLRVVRKGKVVAHRVIREPDSTELTFRLVESIGEGAADRYWIYYGNPGAKEPEPVGMFEFSGPDTLKPAPGVKTSKKEGALEVTGPGILEAPKVGDLDAFRFTTAFTLTEGQGRVTVRLVGRPPKRDPVPPERIRNLIEDLGDDSYQVREEATETLIKLGPLARPAVRVAFEKTRDPEIRWRCEFILQEVEKRSPTPQIVAEVVCSMSAATFSLVIGGRQHVHRVALTGKARIHLTVTRMERHGSVRIVSGVPGRQDVWIGMLKEPIQGVRFEIPDLSERVRIESLRMDRYLSPQGRPTIEIDVEESRK